MVRRKIGMRLGAIVLAATLATTAAPSGMISKVMADEQTGQTNYFVDGDLGDDESDDLWNSGNWKFTDSTWNAVYSKNGVSYSEWAKHDGTSGLAFSFEHDGTAGMYQTISNLKAGTYTITGWTKDTNSKGCNITAYINSESETLGDELTISDNFQKFTYKFTIDEDKTDFAVGFKIDGKEGAWVCLDSLSLEESKSDEEEKNEALGKLESAINDCNGLNESYYRESSWKTLTNALDVAKAIKGNSEGKTAEEINAAADAVYKAKRQLKQKSLHVEKIDNLSSDFIKGVDVSSYVSITDSGAAFKDWDGNKIDQAGFFNLLKNAGVNYVRIRIWNNPYDVAGKGYGGGNSDLEKAKTIGKLATDAGMKVLIDFHYSDFWADPDRQTAPKAWSEYTVDQKKEAVYNYTKTSLEELRNAGVDVGMVQVGNETNHGIAGVMETDDGGWTDICKIFSAGSKAVRDVSSDILVAVHFTDPQTPGNYEKISETLNENKVDYDVFASSYYPSMHGSLSNLTSVLKQVADTYNKKVMVAETSWAWTTEDGDGYGNSFDSTKAYDYSISEQGQANILRDVMQAVANVGNSGIGMFYWEPAWLPANYAYNDDGTLNTELYKANQNAWLENGCGWASENAIDYDGDHVERTGGSVIDNQALFDFEGNPLESLNVFKYVNTGSAAPYKVLDVVKTIAVNAKSAEEAKAGLPETVTGTYNDGTTAEFSVTWDKDALEKVSGFNVYTIPGSIEYKDEYGNDKVMKTNCTLAVVPDSYIENSDFENGNESWTVSNADGVEIKWNDTPIRGKGAMHFYSSSALDFSIEQTVEIPENGTYAACMQVQGGDGNDADDISVEITNVTTGEVVTASTKLNGWCEWTNPATDSIKVAAGDTVRVRVGIKAKAGAWGSIDDVFLYRTGEYVPETKKDDTTTDDKENTDKDDKKENVEDKENTTVDDKKDTTEDKESTTKPENKKEETNTYTGLAKNNGEWCYYNNGKVDCSYTGLCKYNGTWFYVREGKVDFSATTLCKYNGAWWYVSGGKVNFNATGLCKYNGAWWYISGGKVNFNATGLCKYNGTWWYVQNGKVNFGATTLCKYNGAWWYVSGGKVNFNATGLCKYNGTWWYVQSGKVNFGAITLCKYNGTWWYVQSGKVNFGATTLCKYNGTWWYVQNGKVNFSKTTLCKYGKNWYAVAGGKVAWGYSGRINYNGRSFTVVNGVVKF